MEKRKELLSAFKLCRFCLCQDNSLTNLYDRSNKPKNLVPLSLKILSSVSIEVFPSDKMPSYICNRCRFFMDICYEYKQIVHQTDETILNYIQNGTAMENVSWPSLLNKVYNSANKIMKSPPVVKTIVEGGATVQMPSPEEYESEEEDDENVFNIKIDELEDGSKNVKVVTSKTDSDFANETSPRKVFTTVSKLTKHLRTHAGERSYPCKYCSKSFLKSHHYTRHLRLKHRMMNRSSRGPFGEMDQYRCEQCEDSFATQDDLIYHSAIHATQNLTCPLCQEKFDNVDAVTAHIKSHVNGIEFMCDLCELVFTTKEKLDSHVNAAHEEELRNSQDSSMEMEAEEDDDDNSINVKEEDDHVVVEIKKAENFLLDNASAVVDTKQINENTNSEESDSETYVDLSTVNPLAVVRKEAPTKLIEKEPVKQPTTPASTAATAPVSSITVTPTVGTVKSDSNQTASILRKAEEIKRKVQQNSINANKVSNKEKTNNKVESTNTVGASDKSLRLLEKELQDLKRTNSRNEPAKTPGKNVEMLRTRRPQIHTSTPKQRVVEEKKAQLSTKTVIEKKVPERRVVTKENKEPKDVKDVKTSNTNAKETNTNPKENNEKDVKEKDTSKGVVKNGAGDKSNTEENVRRSTRPSKIKDYAKMIRDRIRTEDSDEEESDVDDEEYDGEKNSEIRNKPRRNSSKPPAKPSPMAVPSPAAVAAQPKKRGRPRKDLAKEVPTKMKKEDVQAGDDVKLKKTETENSKSKKSPSPDKDDTNEQDTTDTIENDPNKTTVESETKEASNVLVSPTGQTLKKVPIKALPPGVKPLPLPGTARPIGTGELCEMQIGKKMVKVQKIVMTKAEVEAMAKKGLVEMKDGTMVLKQGIKLPTSDPATLKSTLVGEKEIPKESPLKKAKIQADECENV